MNARLLMGGQRITVRDLDWVEALSLASWLVLESGHADDMRELLALTPEEQERRKREERRERVQRAIAAGAVIVEG